MSVTESLTTFGRQLSVGGGGVRRGGNGRGRGGGLGGGNNPGLGGGARGPVLVGVGTLNASQNAYTVSFPAGYQAGDLALLVVAGVSFGANMPTGFTTLLFAEQTSAFGASIFHYKVGWRLATASEPDVTLTPGGGGSLSGIIVVRGINPITPLDTFTAANLGAISSTPFIDVTTTVPDAFVISMLVNGADLASTTYYSNLNSVTTNLDAIDFRAQLASAASGGITLALLGGRKSSAGLAPQSSSVTLGTADAGGVGRCSFSLRPA